MINEIKIFIIIEIIILYILIRTIYIIYKKQQIENEHRLLVLEKRIEDYKIENYQKYNDLNNTINVLLEYKKFENYSKYNKLEKKVKKK